jgi:hypothetical protein
VGGTVHDARGYRSMTEFWNGLLTAGHVAAVDCENLSSAF